MNKRVVMALIGRYFQEKMEKFSIIECWRYGVLHSTSASFIAYFMCGLVSFAGLPVCTLILVLTWVKREDVYLF